MIFRGNIRKLIYKTNICIMAVYNYYYASPNNNDSNIKVIIVIQ